MAEIAALNTRIVQGMARAEKQYDDAIVDLKLHRTRMSAEESNLVLMIAKLRRRLEPLFADDGKLTSETGTAAMAYLKALARLQRVRQARRLAFTKGGAMGIREIATKDTAE